MWPAVVLLVLLSYIPLTPRPAIGQVVEIGALILSDAFSPSFNGFKQKMAELGYVEGKNLSYRVYNAMGDPMACERLAARMLENPPNLIVTSTTTATHAVAKITRDIPVVFLQAGNPLKMVKSYASSGNNLTGISTSAIDLTAKRLELLIQLTPGIRRVILPSDPNAINYPAYLRASRIAAEQLGLLLKPVTISPHKTTEDNGVSSISRASGDGVILVPDPVIESALHDITRQAIRQRLPLVGVGIHHVRAGALVAYSPDNFSVGRQGAFLVDRILKGAKPADLPIELPSKLRLVINLQTARAVGLEVPQKLVLRADELVK